MADIEIPFKVLYRKEDIYICDLETEEFGDLENQDCWKVVNIQDAGIR